MYESLGFPSANEIQYLVGEEARRAGQTFSREQSIYRVVYHAVTSVFGMEIVPPITPYELALALDDLTAFFPLPVVERRKIKVRFVDKEALTPDEGLLR